MAYLIERRAQILYISASLVKDKGKRRKIVIESRPEFAIVRLLGAKGQFPIAWEMIYEAAMRHHAANLRLEAEAEKSHKAQGRKAAD